MFLFFIINYKYRAHHLLLSTCMRDKGHGFESQTGNFFLSHINLLVVQYLYGFLTNGETCMACIHTCINLNFHFWIRSVLEHLLIFLVRSTLIISRNTLPFQHIWLFPADIFFYRPNSRHNVKLNMLCCKVTWFYSLTFVYHSMCWCGTWYHVLWNYLPHYTA